MRVLSQFICIGTLVSIAALSLPQARAGTVSVPTSATSKRPANDLSYQGRRIDDSEAGDLMRRGVELWRLNPEESLLWKDARLDASDESLQHFPADGATVRFDSYLASTKGIFRASVDGIDEAARAAAGGAITADAIHPFTLSVSLSNPAALMRAALLRRIGYQVSNPKLYHSLTIQFADKAARDSFLDNLADRSLTSRKRWIRSQPDDKPEVTLQGVVLEPGRIHVQTVHWGLMSQALQQDRRVFRALLVPDVLLDFTEKVNTFAWDPARIFNGSVTFDYLFSDGFSDVSYDDVKWVIARIARLTRDELREAVELAGLPRDITAILVEKVISRRDALVKLVGLAPEYPLIPYVTDINTGNVLHGQLTKDDYEGYPQEFFAKADQPPLRWSQLWRYAAIEGISAGVSELLNLINSDLLTYESSATAVTNHQSEVTKGIASYLFKTGSLNGYQQTTGVWGKPLLGGNINASRTVVAGTYLGSDSQVQLVDTLSVSLGGGFYLGWDGAPFIPGIGNTVTLSRSYAHVKPVQDMNTALKTNWGRLVVAGFMRKLSMSLNPSIQCSIPEGPWTSEFEVDGVKFTKINYDSKRPNGKEEALQMRAQLIAQGANPDRIILQANERESDCKGEVEKAVNKNLGDFMDGLAVGDTFIITDSIQLGAVETVNIPITTLAGFIDVSVAPTANQGYAIARQTMIRRTADGFQVYLQKSRLDTETFGMDLNFWINVFNYTQGVRHGKAATDFYNIVTEGADTDTKVKLIRSLKALLRANNSEILTDSFQPYTLKHDLLARILKFKFLLWSVTSENQLHEVNVFPPLDPKGNRNRGDYKRTLAMRRMVTQKGQDWFGFLVGVASRLTGGIVALPGVGSGTDPGNSPGGKSFTAAITTQAEITDGVAMKPVTAVEQTYRGWLLSRKDMYKIFDRIEGVYGSIKASHREFQRGLFDRTIFTNTSKVQLYQIDTTLMFYPEALTTVKSWLFHDYDERALFDYLVRLNGESRTQIYCDITYSQFGADGPQIYYGRGFRACAPDWVHGVMKLRAKGFPDSDKRAQLAWYNSLMSYFVNNANVATFLQAIDSRNYFFVTRVNGYRKNDATGSVDYLSDTVGHYDNERGLGIYRDFASSYGISLFELYARYFTDGI